MMPLRHWTAFHRRLRWTGHLNLAWWCSHRKRFARSPVLPLVMMLLSEATRVLFTCGTFRAEIRAFLVYLKVLCRQSHIHLMAYRSLRRTREDPPFACGISDRARCWISESVANNLRQSRFLQVARVSLVRAPSQPACCACGICRRAR